MNVFVQNWGMKHTTPPQSVADRVAIALKRSPYNQREFAELLGVAPSMISEWFNGKRQIRHEMVRKIAQILDVKEAWLLGIDESSSDDRENNALLLWVKATGMSFADLVNQNREVERLRALVEILEDKITKYESGSGVAIVQTDNPKGGPSSKAR